MPAASDRHTARRRLAGLAFLLVMVLLAGLSVALYQKKFTPVAMVTLYSDSAGSEMHIGAQVMVRGVQVGEVRQVTTSGNGARLELAIQPAQLRWLPVNVSAELLPATLFGERYVDLIIPRQPAARTLAAGGVIRQNRSADAVELERVLNNLLPLLTALQPAKLSVTLTAIAQGLQGRGQELGETLVTLSSDLRQLNPQLPALDADIRELAGVARTYAQASPAIVQSLSDLSRTSQTIVSDRAGLTALFSTVTTASADLRAFLAANSDNIIRLSATSLATLRILAAYSPEFPCTLRDLAQFVPAADRALGRGTRQPGLHAQVIVVPSPGKYLPGIDTPRFGDNLGPRCYPVPFPGIRLKDGAQGRGAALPVSAGSGTGGKSSAAGGKASARAATPIRDTASGGPAGQQPTPPRAAGPVLTPNGPAGLPGSPAENELARELAGLSLGQSASSLPGWSGLLVAPLFRGTEVSVEGGRT